MKPDVAVTTGPDGLVALTTPSAGDADVRVAIVMEPGDAARLGGTLIKHAVAALEVKAEGRKEG